MQIRLTVLQAITGDGDEMDEYHFPDARLKKKMDDPEKTPLLLVACGSFSPITFLHLRMFVMVADYVKHSTEFEMVGGYLSPVSDAYKKQGLAPAIDRSVPRLPRQSFRIADNLQSLDVPAGNRQSLQLAHGGLLGG